MPGSTGASEPRDRLSLETRHGVQKRFDMQAAADVLGAQPGDARSCENRLMQFDDVLAVLAALASAKVDYVLVGGVAVGLHGFERATNDIDLFVRTDEENIDRLRAALHSVYDDPSIEEISAVDLAGEYPTVRYGPPSGDYFIDLLGRLGSEIRYDDLEFQIMEIEGVPVRLATPKTLYRMKRDTVRPIDRIDAETLRARFSLDEES